MSRRQGGAETTVQAMRGGGEREQASSTRLRMPRAMQPQENPANRAGAVSSLHRVAGCPTPCGADLDALLAEVHAGVERLDVVVDLLLREGLYQRRTVLRGEHLPGRASGLSHRIVSRRAETDRQTDRAGTVRAHALALVRKRRESNLCVFFFFHGPQRPTSLHFFMGRVDSAVYASKKKKTKTVTNRRDQTGVNRREGGT